MAGTESLRQVAHARAPLSAWFGIVLLFALFGVIVLAIIGPSPRRSDYEETRAKKRVENLKSLRDEADKALTTYAWVDKNKGLARIPIDRAMELTVSDLAQKKPAPAGAIATPAIQTAPAGASPTPGASQGAAVSSPPSSGAGQSAQPGAPAGASSAPAASQQQGAVSSPPSATAASPSPATQQSPLAPASPAPAATP